jgi:hypothetical protein
LASEKETRVDEVGTQGRWDEGKMNNVEAQMTNECPNDEAGNLFELHHSSFI